MEILKFAVPAITGALGLVKLLDKRSAAMRVLTTVLIIVGGAGSAVLVRESGRTEERRAVAAEQAQRRAEAKLDKMTDALLDIQQDLAELQVQLARSPQSSTGAALKATLLKLDNARKIVKPDEVRKEQAPAPAPPSPSAKPSAGSSDTDDR